MKLDPEKLHELRDMDILSGQAVSALLRMNARWIMAAEQNPLAHLKMRYENGEMLISFEYEIQQAWKIVGNEHLLDKERLRRLIYELLVSVLEDSLKQKEAEKKI